MENRPRIKIRKSQILEDCAYLALLSFLFRILPILFGCESTDIMLYRQQAIPVLNHQNIYQVTNNVFPYSPLTMFIPAFCLFLSTAVKVPFYVVMKIPALLGDIFLSIAIYYWLLKMWQDKKLAFRGGVLYAINPLAILVSAFHGNLMSIPTLVTFLAVIMVAYAPEENYRLSALLLGLAIGFRGYAVLLLPLFLLKSKATLARKVSYVAYAILPTLLLFIPFLLLDHKSIFREVFSYSSWTDYGFAAISRAWYSFRTGIIEYGLPRNIVVFLAINSKTIFLLAYAAILLRHKKFNLITLALLVYLGFYFFYAGVASQYFVWILPFFYFLKDKISKWYVILGSYALMSFYLIYHPSILFGRFNFTTSLSLRVFLFNEFLALALFWIFCGVWFFILFFKREKSPEMQ